MGQVSKSRQPAINKASQQAILLSQQSWRIDLRWLNYLAACLILLSLSGCLVKEPAPSKDHEEPTTIATDKVLESPTLAATLSVASTDASLLESLTLGLPPRWLSAGEAALASLPPGSIPNLIRIQALEPTLAQLQSGSIDLAILPDTSGIHVADRAIAFAVPWTADWEHLSLAEAESILADSSPFVAVLEWPELSPTLKPLRIDGLHPSHSDYPLKESWSLHVRPGLEDLAIPLAHALSIQMADRLVQITAVGDIMLARGLGDAIRNGDYPFAAVQHLLNRADLTIGNLESALGDGGQPEDKGYTFLAPPEAAERLALAGFDVLSLANNHAMDYGSQILLQGIELLDAQEILAVGAGVDDTQAFSPIFFEAGDVVVAVLAFVDVPVEVRGFDTRSWNAAPGKAGVAWADPQRMRDGIVSAQSAADSVIVLLHSGYEYINTPSPPQRFAAHLAIDAGADLVIGHHAHVLQGIEYYGDGIIVYGLGNFAFEDGGVGDTGLMHIWIDDRGIRSLEFVPLLLPNDGRPIPADPVRAERIRANLYDLTRVVEP